MRVAVDCSLAVIYAAMFLISQWYAMCADSKVTELILNHGIDIGS